MPSINPVKYDNWWVELNVYWRTTDVSIYQPEQVQIDNMNLVHDYFSNLGWTHNAISGMLGNMMVESTVNPWLFQHHTLDWSNPAAIQADNGGMGLTQWTPCRKYYDWAIQENKDPQSGYTMCDRIKYEYDNNLQWSLDNVGHYTWDDFITATDSPEYLARVFVWAYERPSDPDVAQRQRNARWCFDNIHGSRLRPTMMVLLSRQNQKKGVKKRWQII